MMFEFVENCHRLLYRVFLLRASNNSYYHSVFYYITILEVVDVIIMSC